jgi:hypothetical protein
LTERATQDVSGCDFGRSEFFPSSEVMHIRATPIKNAASFSSAFCVRRDHNERFESLTATLLF